MIRTLATLTLLLCLAALIGLRCDVDTRAADVEVTSEPSTQPAQVVDVDGQKVLILPPQKATFKLPDPDKFQDVTLKWIAALTVVFGAAFGLIALVWGKVRELKQQNVEQEKRANRNSKRTDKILAAMPEGTKLGDTVDETDAENRGE